MWEVCRPPNQRVQPDQDEPKTASAGRILPIPDALLAELTAAKARQAAEKLARGAAYANLGYVVYNEAGEPYHPSTLSKLWQAAITAASDSPVMLRTVLQERLSRALDQLTGSCHLVSGHTISVSQVIGMG